MKKRLEIRLKMNMDGFLMNPMEKISGEWVMDRHHSIILFIITWQVFRNMIISDQIKLERD